MTIWLVLLPIWIATASWFVGASAALAKRRRLHGVAWLIGSCCTWIHIIASYGIVHSWSHQAAIAATRQQSLEVTGVAAGWGVYVNFVFVILWTLYSLAVITNARLSDSISYIFFAFATLIIVSATVIFETGAVRLLSFMAFACLTLQLLFSNSVQASSRRKIIQKRSSDG